MGATGERIGLEDRGRWNAALDGMAHGYWHTHAACSALQHGIPGAIHLYALQGDRIRAACPFAERSWHGATDLYSPAGFSGFVIDGDAAAVQADWRRFVSRHGYVAGYLALHPVFGARGAHAAADLVQTNELFVLDLRDGAAAVLAETDRSVRRALRRWHDEGSAYVTDRDALVAFIGEHYQDFMERMGANPSATWTGETLQALLADPAVWLVGAEDASGICAAYAFATTPYGAETLVNVSVREGRKATTALISWGIERLAAAGVRWLHLGGGVVRGDAIAAAKLKFRPLRRPLLSAREVYDVVRYHSLCAAAGVADSTARSYFPAYRAPASTPENQPT